MTDAELVSFGETLRNRRQEKGLTQEAVAAEAFGNPDRKTYVSAIENGRRANLTEATVLRLAGAVGIAREDVPKGLRWPDAAETPASVVFDTAIARVFNNQLRQTLSDGAQDIYGRMLSHGLNRLDHWTGSPFGRRSLGVSFTLSFVYVVLIALAGYAVDGPGIGTLDLFFKPTWAQPVPQWLLALGCVALLGVTAKLCLQILSPTPDTSNLQFFALRLPGAGLIAGGGCIAASLLGVDQIGVGVFVATVCFAGIATQSPRVAALAGLIGGTVAGVGAGALNEKGILIGLLEGLVIGGGVGAVAGWSAGAMARLAPTPSAARLAGAGLAVAIGATAVILVSLAAQNVTAVDARTQTLIVLMWIILPSANALADYFSLGISHLLGRYLLRGPRRLGQCLGVILVDIAAALVLLLLTFWAIYGGLALADALFTAEVSGDVFLGHSLHDPWGRGIWLTLMLLSSLAWTYAHFALIVAPSVAAHLTATVIEAPLMTRLKDSRRLGEIDTLSAAILPWRHMLFWIAALAIAATPLLALARVPDLLARLLNVAGFPFPAI